MNQTEGGQTGLKRVTKQVVARAMQLFDRLTDASMDDLHIVRREARLFLGSALALSGLLHLQHGKYCDGNAADYLSCTRPATYYYYGAFEIILAVVGISLILVWFLRRSHK